MTAIAKLLAVRKLRQNFNNVSNAQKTDFWVHDREIFSEKSHGKLWKLFEPLLAVELFKSYYRVSQQVLDRLNVILKLRSLLAKITKFSKKCISLQKIAFESFFVNCKIENGIFSIFVPIVLCSNLFSKLIKIGEKLLKNPFSL